ncbi:Spo7-domain-containing protein [Yamadazyma tenuis ATCC 10573]|uniref:Spo7-domain-containing protein n=2 Tax=Candida tenuis TaxID=2315449 RepID=G3BBZ4_CANTC|nr:Spo7-domain-containing protein [Yamadazyma tenuis ATCC 10573]EGV60122.1 Spo7-domain-containing protein [Yamadazyma tenuis ATCC 10573]
MNLTPYSSQQNDNDEYVMYSDSEIGSQNSLDLPIPLKSSSVDGMDDRDSSPSRSAVRRIKSASSKRRTSPRRDSGDSGTPSPKQKKKIRRKSNKSEGSEKSHPVGGGYASAPGTGKIFRNLLILEESLRDQVAQQRGLRRKYLTFMAILCAVITSIAHHLYFSNYETSSPFRVVLTFVLLALMITLLLYYLSGEYQKTIVLPRKFLSSTNKGLRQLNVRLVKIKTPLIDLLSDLIREFSLFVIMTILNLIHKFDPSLKHNKDSKIEVFFVSCQSQCQPRVGIADVKLVLNARVFNTDIREGWELYRSEFWIREGVRRRNNLMSFVTGNNQDESILDKEKLLNRDRRERRDRKKSNTGAPVSTGAGTGTSTPTSNKLNDQNLRALSIKLHEMDDSSPSLTE